MSNNRTTPPKSPPPPPGAPNNSPFGKPPPPPNYITVMDVETGVGPEQIGLEEVNLILKTTLRSMHYNSPTVIMFIKNYLICRDVKQAALEAGLTAAQGRALRAQPDVYAAIGKLTEKAIMKDGLDVTEIIARVREIMDVDIAEFQNDDGSYKVSLKDIPPETRRAVKSFKVKNLYEADENGIRRKVGEIVDVELWDKMKATDMLGREKGLFKQTNVVQHDVTTNMKDVLLASAKRAEDAVIASRDVTPAIEGKKVE